MQQLKKDLQAVLKSLKQARERTEGLMRRLEALDRPQAAKKAEAKAPKKVSDSDAVLAIIGRYKKGVKVATLKDKIGLEGRTVNDIIYRLKKQGKIKSSGKGIYLKA